MSTGQDVPRPNMAISDVQLKLPQVQAAMKAMMDYAQERSPSPVCMAIVDASGNLEAFAKMEGRPVIVVGYSMGAVLAGLAMASEFVGGVVCFRAHLIPRDDESK